MTLRQFVHCDVCNPQGIRYIDRRAPSRSGDGRRWTDGRGFIDGDVEVAIAAGWKIDHGRHICPRCQQRLDGDPSLAGRIFNN